MDGASAVDVLRLETANLSAWPAERLHHDGTWLLRRTPGHGSKRLNSLNFLDPADDRDAEARLAAMAAASRRHGLDPTVRITPLTPPSVVAASLPATASSSRHATSSGCASPGLTHSSQIAAAARTAAATRAHAARRAACARAPAAAFSP